MPDESPSPSRRLSSRARRVLRELHQRTWELEFLMSGALAVGLGQIPGRLDASFNRLYPLLGDGSGTVLLLGYQYLKLILYILVLTFVVHITLRAFWVSLIGLDSVFPRGVRWDRTRHGPHSRSYLRRHLPSVRELIVRTDGIASVLFAAAFQLVAMFVVSIVAVGLMAVPVFLLGSFTNLPFSADSLLVGTAVVIATLMATPTLIDRVRGDTIDPDSLMARWIRGSHWVNVRLLGQAVYGPAQQTLASQLGGRRAGALVAVVLVGVSALFIVRDVLLERDRLQIGPLTFVPTIPGANGVDPRYYEALWLDGPPPLPSPSIPSDALDDETAWVRLFVPFRATADPDAIQTMCPALAPISRSGIRLLRPERGLQTDTLATAIEESLACASRLWNVGLDGTPTDESPVFATHPVTGLPGLSWYIGVRDLPPGRHLLTVHRSAAAQASDREAPHRHEIPFWR